MNTDQLSMVPAHATIQTVYGLISGAQGHPTPQQIAACAVLFNETCLALRLDPSQQLDAARRLARHAEEHFSIELRALREYIRKELGAPALSA